MLLSLMKKNVIGSVFLLVFFFLGLKSAALAETPSSLAYLEQLDLESAVKTALADSPTLAAAKERITQAKQFVVQCRAGYFPSVNASLSYQWFDNADKYDTASDWQIPEDLRANWPEELGNPDLWNNLGNEYNEPTDSYSAGLSATWLLFDGFEREFSYAAAKHGVEQTRYSLADARRLIIGAVAKAYFSALLAKANIDIAKADEGFNDRLLKETRAMQIAGLASISDVMNFEVRGNYAHSKVLEAQRNYEAARYGLAALMGIAEAQLPENLKLAPLTTETDEMLSPPNVIEAISYAKTHRPDILAQNETIKIFHATVGVANAQFYPDLRLNGSMNGTREDDLNFEGDDFSNSISVVLSYNLFAGGRHRSRLIQSKSQLNENKKKLQEITSSAIASIRAAVAMVNSAQEQFQLQQVNTKLATENRDLVRKEFLAGKGTLVRLNEAQKDLTTIQSYLAQARVTLRQAWSDLEKESGRILERYGVVE